MLFGSRKGDANYLLIEAMEAVAAILVLIGALMFVNSSLDIGGFASKFYARDIAFMIDTSLAAPENLLYLYNVNPVEKNSPQKYLFDFSASDGAVKVNATNVPRQNVYWYFSDKSLEPVQYSEAGRIGIVKFSKMGGKLNIGLNAASNPKVISCPIVDTAQKNWLVNTVVVDPRGLEARGDFGNVNSADNNFREDTTSMAVALGLSAMKTGQVVLTRTVDDAEAPLQKRAGIASQNSGAGTLIISVSAGTSANSNENYIKAYYNIDSDYTTRMKSIKLGCKILNAMLLEEGLAGREKIKGAAVIGTDSYYATSLIPAGSTGVMLELGNIQIARNDNFLADTNGIAESIKKGLEEYYS